MTHAPKPKKLRLKITIQIEGEEGMNEFARMLKVMHDNGHQGTVKRLVGMLVTAAEKEGATVSPEVRAFL